MVEHPNDENIRYSKGGSLQDVAAPGSYGDYTGIEVADANGNDWDLGLKYAEGTSYAAPAVSGLAAYYLSIMSRLHVEGEVPKLTKAHILKTAYSRSGLNLNTELYPKAIWNELYSTVPDDEDIEARSLASAKIQDGGTPDLRRREESEKDPYYGLPPIPVGVLLRDPRIPTSDVESSPKSSKSANSSSPTSVPSASETGFAVISADVVIPISDIEFATRSSKSAKLRDSIFIPSASNTGVGVMSADVRIPISDVESATRSSKSANPTDSSFMPSASKLGFEVMSADVGIPIPEIEFATRSSKLSNSLSPTSMPSVSKTGYANTHMRLPISDVKSAPRNSTSASSLNPISMPSASKTGFAVMSENGSPPKRPHCQPSGAAWLKPTSFCDCGHGVTYSTLNSKDAAKCGYTRYVPSMTVTVESMPTNVPGVGGRPVCATIAAGHGDGCPAVDYCFCNGYNVKPLPATESGVINCAITSQPTENDCLPAPTTSKPGPPSSTFDMAKTTTSCSATFGEWLPHYNHTTVPKSEPTDLRHAIKDFCSPDHQITLKHRVNDDSDDGDWWYNSIDYSSSDIETDHRIWFDFYFWWNPSNECRHIEAPSLAKTLKGDPDDLCSKQLTLLTRSDCKEWGGTLETNCVVYGLQAWSKQNIPLGYDSFPP